MQPESNNPFPGAPSFRLSFSRSGEAWVAAHYHLLYRRTASVWSSQPLNGNHRSRVYARTA